jgi:hypothetical protein
MASDIAHEFLKNVCRARHNRTDYGEFRQVQCVNKIDSCAAALMQRVLRDSRLPLPIECFLLQRDQELNKILGDDFCMVSVRPRTF